MLIKLATITTTISSSSCCCYCRCRCRNRWSWWPWCSWYPPSMCDFYQAQSTKERTGWFPIFYVEITWEFFFSYGTRKNCLVNYIDLTMTTDHLIKSMKFWAYWTSLISLELHNRESNLPHNNCRLLSNNYRKILKTKAFIRAL